MIKQQNNLDDTKSSTSINQNTKEDTDNGEIKLSGFVTAWIIKDGVETLAHKKSNLVVANGRKILAELLSSGTVSRKISSFKLGTGVVDPNDRDEDLGTPDLFSQLITQNNIRVDETLNTITYTINVLSAKGNSTDGSVRAYTEAGLFSGGTPALMYARETFPIINKQAGTGLKFEWVLSF